MSHKELSKIAILGLIKNRCYTTTAIFYFTQSDSKRGSIMSNMPDTSLAHLTTVALNVKLFAILKSLPGQG